MGRQKAAALCLAFAVLLAAGTAQAQTPVVRVRLGDTGVFGQGWGDAKELKATLRDAAGLVKGACWVKTMTGGSFSCGWGQGLVLLDGLVTPATNEPGDELTVEHEGSTYTSGPFSAITITGLNPDTDAVSGFVRPRRPTLRVSVHPDGRLTPGGIRFVPEIAASVVPEASGAFAVDLSAAGNPVRGDFVSVTYVRGRFEIGVSAAFPGLVIQKDANFGVLAGVPGSVHRVALPAADGTLKSESLVTLGGGHPIAADSRPGGMLTALNGGAEGFFSFLDAAGRQVRIREGDVIVVGGPLGFAFRVPKLTIGRTASRSVVRTLPNQPLQFFCQIFNGPGVPTSPHSVFGKADGAGLFIFDPAAAITPYSMARAMIILGGNHVSTSGTVAPQLPPICPLPPRAPSGGEGPPGRQT